MARHCPAPQLPQIKCTNQGFPSRRPFAASHSRPRDAPRDTNHGLYGRSVGRWCARVAQPETAARTAAPAAQSMLPCSLLPGIARNFPAPFYCLPAHDCAALWGIVRNCAVWGAVLLPLSKCPRTVRRSRWASRRAPFAAAPVALQAASAAANAKGTHAEKGEPSILHKQGIFLYCVDSRTSRFDPSHPIRYSQKTSGTQALAGIGRFRSSRQLLGVAA